VTRPAGSGQHRPDAILIRDLILATDFPIEQHKPIYMLAAARSEVLNALNVPTLEINKILSDRYREGSRETARQLG
jgi:hypothetical protein